MSDVFAEVNADLRKDRLQSLWDKYGYYVLGAIAAIILGVGAQAGYSSLQRTANEEASVRYAALVATAPTQESLAAFASAEDNGYGALAAFTLAVQQAEAGAMREALSGFDALATQNDLPKGLQDYARLQAAIILLDSASGSADDIAARLAPLLAQTGGFNPMARDIMGLAWIKSGDKDKARALFEAQKTDETTSRFARERANIMLDTLGNKK